MTTACGSARLMIRQAVAAKEITLVEDRDIRAVKNQIHRRSEMKRCANSCHGAEWRRCLRAQRFWIR
jgi:hypothetical protein